MISTPRPSSSRAITAPFCHPRCLSRSGLPGRAGRLAVVSGLDAPQLRLKARSVLRLEPAHILNAGACDVDGPVRSSENVSGQRKRLSCTRVVMRSLSLTFYCILLNCAEIKPPPPFDPKAIRRLRLGDKLDTSFDVLLRQAWVLQHIRRDAIKGPAGQCFPIERPPVRRERDAVSSKFHPAPIGPAQLLPINLHHHILFRLGARVAIKDASTPTVL
jgi:hypothetical protein